MNANLTHSAPARVDKVSSLNSLLRRQDIAKPSNTGIAYCEFGFGPASPWGLVFLSGASQMSIGMDSGWYGSFMEVYFESKAATDLSVWRVFKQEGDAYPGVALTEESDWDSTWREVYGLRAADPSSRYHCSHSIQLRPDET